MCFSLSLLVQSQPNYAMDVGIYEFAFQDGSRVRARYSFLYTKEDGEWKIKHHHSSGMPETKGQVISQDEVRQLFTLWNDALLTGNSYAVANRYAKNAVLLPTVSDRPRTDYDGIKDYFDGFLKLNRTVKLLTDMYPLVKTGARMWVFMNLQRAPMVPKSALGTVLYTSLKMVNGRLVIIIHHLCPKSY